MDEDLNEKIKLYKLERKNKYYNCIAKGVIVLVGCYVIIGTTYVFKALTKEEAFNAMQISTDILFISTLGYSFIKTLPDTKKIVKVKKELRRRKSTQKRK